LCKISDDGASKVRRRLHLHSFSISQLKSVKFAFCSAQRGKKIDKNRQKMIHPHHQMMHPSQINVSQPPPQHMQQPPNIANQQNQQR
jgi:hypothetical protein